MNGTIIKLGIAIAFVCMSGQVAAKLDFSNPTLGDEYGIEYQLEKNDDGKFVERTLARYQRTYDWQPHINENGNSFDREAKIGSVLGYYKGSKLGSGDDFGSYEAALVGITGEAIGTYTFDTGKMKPLVGLSVDAELLNIDRRIEWQADALVGLKFDVSSDKDLVVRYRKTLVHGMNYLARSDERYRQDDGYAVALIGTKRLPRGKSHSIKLQYEHFDAGPRRDLSDGWFGWEPETENWLVSYKRTF